MSKKNTYREERFAKVLVPTHQTHRRLLTIPVAEEEVHSTFRDRVETKLESVISSSPFRHALAGVEMRQRLDCEPAGVRMVMPVENVGGEAG